MTQSHFHAAPAGRPGPAAELVRALQRENEQLREALSSRIVIEQAKGAMCARFGLAPDEAFAVLRGLARSQQRKLHEFAAEVVKNGGCLDGDVVDSRRSVAWS